MMEPFDNFSTSDLCRDIVSSGGKKIRYNSVDVPLNWFQTLAILFRYGVWRRLRRDFTPILPGEPGYENAIYESSVIYHREAMRCPVLKSPVP